MMATAVNGYTTYSGVIGVKGLWNIAAISPGVLTDECFRYDSIQLMTDDVYICQLKKSLLLYIQDKVHTRNKYYGDIDPKYLDNICEIIYQLVVRNRMKYYGIKQSLCMLSFCQMNNITLTPAQALAFCLVGVGVYPKIIQDKVDPKTGKTIVCKIRFSSLVMKGFKLFDELVDKCMIPLWDVKYVMYALSGDRQNCVGGNLEKDLRFWYLALDPNTQEKNIKQVVTDIGIDRGWDNKKLRSYFHNLLKDTNGKVFKSVEMLPFSDKAVANLKNLGYHS